MWGFSPSCLISCTQPQCNVYMTVIRKAMWVYPGLLWELDTTSASTFISLLLDILVSAMLSVLKWGKPVWRLSHRWSVSFHFPNLLTAQCPLWWGHAMWTSSLFSPFHYWSSTRIASHKCMLMAPCMHIHTHTHSLVAEKVLLHKFGIFTSGMFTAEIVQGNLRSEGHLQHLQTTSLFVSAEGFICMCVHIYRYMYI